MTRTPSLPPRGEAHVWHGHGHGGDPDRDLALLSAEERRHCARLSLAADRCGFAAAWAHARRIVGGYLDQDPAALRIERPDTPGVRQPTRVGTDGGAPVFIGLTRAGRHWLLALAVGDPVGVDLEPLRTTDLAALLGRCLAPEERRQVERLPEAERGEAFARAWTRKEALMKAVGLPRATARHRLVVDPAHPGTVTVRPVQAEPRSAWTVQDLPLSAGTRRAALARPADCTGPVRRFTAA
ncbi:4'-phosphopantetheinyl transferase superfamily protein [Kitasatospora paracochleata]|uniref:4'-phosphopantetheinyl transferase n=1 Tax=Kitasatospora paracochleata TaxID=58354 RepID=A0ABT1J6A7_9ACTN|nr:4'-phosphopantetheinyl transferase superfamily protein [Kitasatospora paracochleata]MCP2312969.1 4'-phosphopantetheinyl transferase [Kitasatospora paracochleata]